MLTLRIRNFDTETRRSCAKMSVPVANEFATVGKLIALCKIKSEWMLRQEKN